MIFTSQEAILLRDLFHRSYNAMNQGEEKLYPRSELTAAQFDVLIALSVLKGPVTVNSISNYLYKSSNSVTMLLDRMEKDGLIKRSRNLQDRRATRVVMTSAGRKILNSLKPAVATFVEKFLSGFSAAEITYFKASLEKICQVCEELQTQAR